MQLPSGPESPAPRHWATIPDGGGGELRVRYVDEGDRRARPVVFLHGTPSSIWRHPIAAVVEMGWRAIVPDLAGTELPDSPSENTALGLARAVDRMRSMLFDHLDIDDAILVLHDRGGIIGLRLVADFPDRVAGVAISDSGLPDRDPAWTVLEMYDRPVVTIFSDRDIGAADGWEPIVERVPGAAGQPHVILPEGGHLLHEEIPEAYTEALTGWLRDVEQG